MVFIRTHTVSDKTERKRERVRRIERREGKS